MSHLATTSETDVETALSLLLEVGTLPRADAVRDLICVPDIGYVQHDRDEMEVLFTFLAERYERKSVIITTNLVFSEWKRIFKDLMTTEKEWLSMSHSLSKGCRSATLMERLLLL
ncbi:MAG: hypothetical protein NVS4B7_20810 [Ktedonobacteraceae bacterium]